MTLVAQDVVASYTQPTMTRAHIQLTIRAVGAADGFAQGVIGLTVIDGTETTPNPIGEGNSNRWALWSPFVLHATGGATTDTSLIEDVSQTQLRFDVKSQRKLTDGDIILLVVELTPASNATVGIDGAASVLIKE